MNDEVYEGELMPVEKGSLEVIQKAEIDIQIATAHKYPRSIAKFKENAIEMVTIDRETAESCLYRRPVGKKGSKVEYAEGLSIRMAEIAAACYRNIRVGAMIVEQTPRYVKARGFAHDLENNNAQSCDILESTVTKEGRPYSERMRIVVAKAAISKARRDATFMVIPRALCRTLEQAAKDTVLGQHKTMEERRAAVSEWVDSLNIDPRRVWSALGISGSDDLTNDHMVTLHGIRTAIRDKDVTVDEAFPLPESEGKSSSNAADVLAKKRDAAQKKTEESDGGDKKPPKKGAQSSDESDDESPDRPQLSRDEATDNIYAVCEAAGVTTVQFTKHLRKKGVVGESVGIETLTDRELSDVAYAAEELCKEIKG